MRMPQVATCQVEPAVGDTDSNIASIERLARDLPDAVEFTVFPELCVTGYDLDFVQSQQFSIPGSMTERLSDVARTTETDLVVGLPEVDGDSAYNSLVYISESGVEATYRKQKLWGNEADQFNAGSTSVTVETSVGTLGLLLCYDLNFPELLLEYANNGCDLLAVSAAWRQSFERDWRLLCRARALDGICYVVGSNHVGTQSGRQHAGESCIASPRGDIVAKTTDGTAAVSTTISPETLAQARQKNPVWKHRK
jgi:predicted amidohydrolase